MNIEFLVESPSERARCGVSGWSSPGGNHVVRYGGSMTETITILHNPRCSKSRSAVAAAQELNVDIATVAYLKEPLDASALRELLGKLEDPVGAAVRRDSFFKECGLTEADVDTVDKIVAVLEQHPRLMERPILIKGDRAIIGRPTERVPSFLVD